MNKNIHYKIQKMNVKRNLINCVESFIQSFPKFVDHYQLLMNFNRVHWNWYLFFGLSFFFLQKFTSPSVTYTCIFDNECKIQSRSNEKSGYGRGKKLRPSPKIILKSELSNFNIEVFMKYLFFYDLWFSFRFFGFSNWFLINNLLHWNLLELG